MTTSVSNVTTARQRDDPFGAGIALIHAGSCRSTRKHKILIRAKLAVPVEAFVSDSHIAVVQQKGFDDGFEVGFAGSLHGRYSNSERGTPDWRMIDISVPVRNSL